MSGSLNEAMLIGNLGADPEIRSLGDGAEVANLRIATTERWKDRTSGEMKEKTEWHRVSVFGDGLVNVCKNYLKKGAKVMVRGKIETRKYEKDGQDVYSTEIVLRGFDAKLTMLDGKNGGDDAGSSNSGGQGRSNSQNSSGGSRSPAPAMADDGFGDDVPF